MLFYDFIDKNVILFDRLYHFFPSKNKIKGKTLVGLCKVPWALATLPTVPSGPLSALFSCFLNNILYS